MTLFYIKVFESDSHSKILSKHIKESGILLAIQAPQQRLHKRSRANFDVCVAQIKVGSGCAFMKEYLYSSFFRGAVWQIISKINILYKFKIISRLNLKVGVCSQSSPKIIPQFNISDVLSSLKQQRSRWRASPTFSSRSCPSSSSSCWTSWSTRG